MNNQPSFFQKAYDLGATDEQVVLILQALAECMRSVVPPPSPSPSRAYMLSVYVGGFNAAIQAMDKIADSLQQRTEVQQASANNGVH